MNKEDDISKMSLPRGVVALICLIIICGASIDTVHVAMRQGNKQKKEMEALDSAVDAHFRAADSIRENTPAAATDSMMRNRDYRFVVENADLIEPLQNIQDSLIDVAARRAQRYSVMHVVPHDESVFRYYRGLRDMDILANRYNMNKKLIDSFYARSARLPEYQRSVRNHFDSVANANIARHLHAADTLLQHKKYLVGVRDKKGR